MKLLQVSQAGVAGAKVVDGEFDPHLVQLAEQGEGLGIGHQQLPLGQLQHQYHLAGEEVAEEGAALGQQGKIVAMGGADVEADMKPIGQLLLRAVQPCRHLLHDMGGHGDDQSRLLRLRDKEIGPDHPFIDMLPAHQHLGAHHLAVVAGNQRLQVGNKLPGPQGTSQLICWRAGAPQHPPHQPGQQKRGNRQPRQRHMPRGPQRLPVDRHGITGMDGERIMG